MWCCIYPGLQCLNDVHGLHSAEDSYESLNLKLVRTFHFPIFCQTDAMNYGMETGCRDDVANASLLPSIQIFISSKYIQCQDINYHFSLHLSL